MNTSRFRETSLHRTPSEATLVGKGFTSEVHAWGDRVLKLFHRSFDRAKAENEFRLARAVYEAGMPAPAVFELVEVEGRCGIVFESVDGASMLRCVQARPWTLFSAIRQLAELHVQIHSCEAPSELPSQREWLASIIDTAPELSLEEKHAAHIHLARLPDGTKVCHGDFHPENVLMTARGPVVIDWGSATRGHPFGDIACTSRLIRHAQLPPWAPLHAHL